MSTQHRARARRDRDWTSLMWDLYIRPAVHPTLDWRATLTRPTQNTPRTFTEWNELTRPLLDGADLQPAVLFDVVCCPAVSPLGQRCEQRRGCCAEDHGHALDVDDVLGVRVAVWRDPAKAKAAVS